MTQITLAFDTTGSQDSMALCLENEIISRPFFPAAIQSSSPKGNIQWQSSMLVPELKSFLADHGVLFQDVKTICTLTGPGSFTGIRIGLATAQGLFIARPCDIFAPTTLDLLLFIGKRQIIAREKASPTIPLIAVIDSKRHDYFALKLSQETAEIVTKDDLAIFIDQGGYVVSSEPIDNIHTLQPEFSLAAELIAFYQSQNNLPQKPFTTLEPFYLRNPEFTKKKSCLTLS